MRFTHHKAVKHHLRKEVFLWNRQHIRCRVLSHARVSVFNDTVASGSSMFLKVTPTLAPVNNPNISLIEWNHICFIYCNYQTGVNRHLSMYSREAIKHPLVGGSYSEGNLPRIVDPIKAKLMENGFEGGDPRG